MKNILLTILLLLSHMLYAETAIVSARCGANNPIKYFYYPTQAEATAQQPIDIGKIVSYPQYGILKPYWDIRYVNPISKYINGGTYTYPNHSKYTGLDVNEGTDNTGMGTAISKTQDYGSITQGECVNGYIAGGTMINSYDAPTQSIEYGGYQSTLGYYFGHNSIIYPWNNNQTGSLILQGYFDKPWYGSAINNPGAEVNLIFYLKHRTSSLQISYVINLYGARSNPINYTESVQYDTSTNISYASTYIDNGTIYASKSPYSKISTQDTRTTTTDDNYWEDFYRVSITYSDLRTFLNDIPNNIFSTTNPEDWKVTLVGVQYELAQEGNASFAGSFRAFEVYLSDTLLLPDNDITPIALNTIINESWNSNTTSSTHRDGSFARYYNFTLSHTTKITIDLTSSKDTYLYLLSGLSQTGTILSEDDDGGSGNNSKIIKTFPAGTYTIEATTRNPSEQASFSLKLNVNVPSQISNLKSFNLTSSNAKLTWNNNSNTELGYKIYQNNSLIATLPSNTKSYQLNELNDNTYYIYDVVPYNEGGDAPKTTVSFTTLPTKPHSPSNLKVSNIDTTSATLTWQDNADNESGFRLYKNNVLIATLAPNTTTYKITGLETRETYNYRIKAVNDAGYSDSIDLSFTTKDDYAWLIPIYHIILN